MNQTVSDETNQEQDILDLQYYKEVQEDIWQHDRKKTMIAIIVIGSVTLISDLLGLSLAHALNATTLVYTLIVPLLVFGLGFLAAKEPLISMIIVTLVYLAVQIIAFIEIGGPAIISGWLVKAVIIFFILRGFVHARVAEKARKNLKTIL